MAHRGLVAVAAVLVLLSSVPLFRIVNVNFTPVDDQSQFDVTVRAPEGSSLAATEILANRVATAIRRIGEVDYTMVTVAGDTAGHAQHRERVRAAASRSTIARAISRR